MAGATIGALAGSVAGPGGADLALLAALAVLCAASSLLEVGAPGHYSMQPNLVLFVWGATQMPAWGIAVLAVLCYLPAALVRGERPWFTVAFNIANYALAGLAVGVIVSATHPFAGGITYLDGLALLGAAVAFTAITHLLVGTIAAIARGVPARMASMGAFRLRETAASAPIDLALAATGVCIALLWVQTPEGIVLAAGPLGLMFAALRVPQLRHRARLEPKTGLCNAEHFDRVLRDAIVTAGRRRERFAVVMLDLDHLRRVNNRHGHLAGDRLIGAVANLLRDATAPGGTAARFGGEEFCLLLPGRSSEQAARGVEEIRRSVQQLGVLPVGPDATYGTVSAGVAAFPEHGVTSDTLLDAADVALYDAKLGGRNRVRVALPGGGAVEPVGPPRSIAPPPLAAEGAAPEPAPAPPARATATAAVPAERRPANLKRFTPWYAGLLVLGALTVGVFSSPARILDDPLLAGVLVACAVALDLVRIDLFERTRTSPAALPVLALACIFGPLGPLAAELAIASVRALQRERPIKWCFDVGALGLAGAAAAIVFGALPAGGTDLIMVGALAGLAYYLVNMPLLSLVIWMSSGSRPLAVWREQFAWLLPHYAAFGSLGGVLVISEERLGVTAFLLFGVPTAVLWVAEKQYLDRSRAGVAELRRRADELETANERLHGLLDHNGQLLTRIHESYLTTITSLARTIEAKDPYTSGHTERVARLAREVAQGLGFEEPELDAVETGAVIHDIGKIGVPDATLLKRGRLTSSERADVQRHPEIASYILADLDLPAVVKQIVRCHHERFDGSGYPDGLAGDEIPLAARIVAVVDALDAMTTERAYRTAMPLDVALAEIAKGAGTQFCPRVVAALPEALARGGAIATAEPAHKPAPRRVVVTPSVSTA